MRPAKKPAIATKVNIFDQRAILWVLSRLYTKHWIIVKVVARSAENAKTTSLIWTKFSFLWRSRYSALMDGDQEKVVTNV